MKLIIANKCYSSWSLRPWLLMVAKDIAFDEVQIPFGPAFDDPDWKAKIQAFSPAGKVPALVDGSISVWESLAIMEYLAERFPEVGIWPSDVAARAEARAISSEMHAGFGALRLACPMNLGKRYAARDRGGKVAADVARISAIWGKARARFGEKADGPYLYGAFSAADAMFAPVVTRLDTYSISVDPVSRTYMDAVLAHPAYRQWLAAALAEPWTVSEDEVDEPALVTLRELA